MKKLISVFLCASMLLTTVVSAAPFDTRTGILERLGITDPLMQSMIETDFDLKVDADITVRKAGDANFVDGPISVTLSSGQAIPKYDFKAAFSMQPVWAFMYEYVDKGVRWLGGDDPAMQQTVRDELKDVGVTGWFDVKIVYPKGLKVPDDFKIANGMEGFNNDAKLSFIETAARTDEVYDSNNNVLTLKVELKPNMTCGQLQSMYDPNDPAKSGDFELVCEDTKPENYGIYTVKGIVTGEIKIGDTTDPISIVDYNAVQKGTNSNETLLATVMIDKKQAGTSGTGTGGSGTGMVVPPVGNKVEVQFSVNGDTTIVNPISGNNAVVVDFDTIVPPGIPGMTFSGWYPTPDCTSDKLTGKQTITQSKIVYGKYILTTAPSVFAEAHKAYIHGYPDGTVQPEGNMTREEINVALYRLLKDDYAASILTTENNYSDVAPDRWSNTTISSMSKAGYIKGYEDGTFRPDRDITRAEFATLILRFFEGSVNINSGVEYADISGHWAENNIKAASVLGLFNGYEDGTFRPEAFITRAEAMAVINRITVRRPVITGFADGYIDWPDMTKADWYYEDVIEATNTHDFNRIDEFMNEQWTDVTVVKLIVG